MFSHKVGHPPLCLTPFETLWKCWGGGGDSLNHWHYPFYCRETWPSLEISEETVRMQESNWKETCITLTVRKHYNEYVFSIWTAQRLRKHFTACISITLHCMVNANSLSSSDQRRQINSVLLQLALAVWQNNRFLIAPEHSLLFKGKKIKLR